MKIILIILFIFITATVSAQNQQKTEIDQNASTYALIEASRQKMTGNLKEAIGLYESCIKANPLCDPAYYELGSIHIFLKDNDKAELYLSKSWELDNDNYWYGIAYSEILKINGKYEKSLNVLKSLRKQSNSNSLALDYKIADLWFSQGKFKKTIKKLNSLEKEHGVSEMITYKKIDAFRKMERSKEMEMEMFKLIERAPDYYGYRIVLAEFYLEAKDTVKAIAAYEKVYELDSTNIFALTNLAKLHIERNEENKAFLYLNRAFENDAIDLRNKIETVIAFNKDRQISPERKKFVEQLVTTLLIKYPENIDVKTVAYDYYNGSNNHVIALNLIKQILEKKSDSYIMWQQAIYNASMLENYDEIINLGDRAIKLFPNEAELYLFVGMSYLQKREYDKAYTLLKSGYKYINALEQNKNQYLIFIAESAYHTKHIEESFSFYEDVLKADPQNDLVKNNYSYFLALEGKNLERARSLSEQTIKKDPENSTFLDTYGWILFSLGRYDEAKVYLEKALTINGEKDAEILFHFAEVLNKLGRHKDSGIYYRKSEEKGFDKETIKLRMDEISKNE